MTKQVNIQNKDLKTTVDNFLFCNINNYNPRDNYDFAYLCKLIYDTEDEIDDQVKKWQKSDSSLKYKVFDIKHQILSLEDEELKGFLDNTSRFMVLYNQHFIILVFRGSSNLTDWMKNFKTWKTDFKEGEGKVHKGFYQTVINMKTQINKTILGIRDNNQNIYITGHSLGGAQALLSAFVCKTLNNFVNITTFGQPRVGDKKFSIWANPNLHGGGNNKSKYFRFVNKYDPVTAVPYNGFYHCGDYYLNCNKKKKYSIVTDFKMEEMPELMTENSEFPDLESLDFQGIPFIQNHYATLYLENALRNITNNIF